MVADQDLDQEHRQGESVRFEARTVFGIAKGHVVVITLLRWDHRPVRSNTDSSGNVRIVEPAIHKAPRIHINKAHRQFIHINQQIPRAQVPDDEAMRMCFRNGLCQAGRQYATTFQIKLLRPDDGLEPLESLVEKGTDNADKLASA